MSTLITRLSSNGTFFTAAPLDEVTYTSNKLTLSALYSAGFDEVTINNNGGGLVKRETNTGQLLISNYFDEVTTIV